MAETLGVFIFVAFLGSHMAMGHGAVSQAPMLGSEISAEFSAYGAIRRQAVESRGPRLRRISTQILERNLMAQDYRIATGKSP